jgi:hypothetical protein
MPSRLRRPLFLALAAALLLAAALATATPNSSSNNGSSNNSGRRLHTPGWYLEHFRAWAAAHSVTLPDGNGRAFRQRLAVWSENKCVCLCWVCVGCVVLVLIVGVLGVCAVLVLIVGVIGGGCSLKERGRGLGGQYTRLIPVLNTPITHTTAF